MVIFPYPHFITATVTLALGIHQHRAASPPRDLSFGQRDKGFLYCHVKFRCEPATQPEFSRFTKHDIHHANESSGTKIDFVVNKASERIYIQSAYAIPDPEERVQGTFSLRHTGDSFKKVVIDGQYSATYRDNDGIVHISLLDFLNNPKSLETL